MPFLPYNKDLKIYASQLRKQLTETELLLWPHLRGKQILGIQFYRQKIIGNYIVDFYAPAVNLVLEIDGSQHYEPEVIEQDQSRDTYLRELGLTVLRFDNHQVKCSLTSVVDVIYDYVEQYLR